MTRTMIPLVFFFFSSSPSPFMYSLHNLSTLLSTFSLSYLLSLLSPLYSPLSIPPLLSPALSISPLSILSLSSALCTPFNIIGLVPEYYNSHKLLYKHIEPLIPLRLVCCLSSIKSLSSHYSLLFSLLSSLFFSLLSSLFSLLYSLFSILSSLFSLLYSLFSIPLLSPSRNESSNNTQNECFMQHGHQTANPIHSFCLF
jgi:hypothetical protein